MTLPISVFLHNQNVLYFKPLFIDMIDHFLKFEHFDMVSLFGAFIWVQYVLLHIVFILLGIHFI